MSFNQTAEICKIPVQERVIKAACEHFEISEENLLKDTQYNVAYMRHLCYYLIKKNTNFSQRFIGFRFKQSRGPVRYGIELIDATKNIYSPTLADLTKIAEKAGISI